MALSSFFKRKKPEDAAGPAEAAAPAKPVRRGAVPGAGGPGSASNLPHESAAVVQARSQARRRLVGAAVLLLLGVVLFPLIFETKPRPLPMDLPITVASSGKAAPAATPVTPVRPAPPMITETAEPEPARAPAAPAVPASSAPVMAAPAPEVKASAPVAAPAPKTKASAPAPTAAPPAKPPAPSTAATPPAATAAPTAPPAVPPSTATTPPAADAAAGRFVVQVGAFADEATVRQTRQKVEKLGFKTYTQEVNTDAGKRVRVRLGPFATKEEATQALSNLKGAGLPGAVLAL